MSAANFIESTSAICELIQVQHDLLVACIPLDMPDSTRREITKTVKQFNALFVIPKIKRSPLRIRNRVLAIA